jgi:hypothetical protein
MVFTTIEQVLAHQFAGNFADDHEAFEAIDAFCMLPTTLTDDLIAAQNHIAGKGMGVPENFTVDNVHDFREQYRHDTLCI